MKLYTFPPAPNPRKLHAYLGEKGIELPTEIVNLVHGEQNAPAYLEISPFGTVPVLELDDGTHLIESLAIIEYLEELHPEPDMLGRDPLERARIRETERVIEMRLLGRIARIVHSTRSPLPGVEPDLETAEKEKAQLPRVLAFVDARIGERPFVMGDRPTVADCTLYGALGFGQMFGLEIDAEYKNVRRWFEAFQKRHA